ncbi:MAG: hypothetical protein COX07_08645 [Bacteroidetes bacterium CG23_combo_of_CG06-09_8_20_14_all_32_9]|nr:MAG: hypothetical protein COX07_08645 [Bacteroidetes bacterium CG23_combo_of_CG06-09_8_20_14_all_32_9]
MIYLKYIKNLLLICISLLLLASCTIREVEIGKIESVSIKDITKEHIALNLMVPVKNNNNFAFTISEVNLDLTLGNVALGKVKQDTKLKIPANSNSIQTVGIDVKFSKLAENPMLLITSVLKNRVNLKANGYIKVRKFLFNKKYKIDENQSVKLFKKGLF